MLEHGYSMDYSKGDRWGEALTLSRSPKIELNSPVACLIAVGALLSMGLLLILLLLGIVTGVWKRKATLVALPTQDSDRTLLTIGGSDKKVEEALVVMVHNVFGGQFIYEGHT